MEQQDTWRAAVEESDDFDSYEAAMRPLESMKHRSYQKELGVVFEEDSECNEECVLPENWANRLAALFKELSSNVNTGDVNRSMEALMKFSLCDGCVSNSHCTRGMNGCEDGIRIMLAVQPHSTVITNVLGKKVYPARKAMIDFMDMDQVM